MRRILVALLLVVVTTTATCQSCQQGVATLALQSAGDCSNIVAISDCLTQMEVVTATTCQVNLKPGIRMSIDGSFCETSAGIIARGSASGSYRLGLKPVDFTLSPARTGSGIVLGLTGTYRGPQGGQEYTLGCSLLFQVISGSLLGVQGAGLPSATGMGMGAMPAAVMDSSLSTGTNGANAFSSTANTGSLTSTATNPGALGTGSSSSMGSLGGMGTGMAGGVGAMGTTMPGLPASGSNQGELNAYGPGMPMARWGSGSLAGGSPAPALATNAAGASHCAITIMLLFALLVLGVLAML